MKKILVVFALLLALPNFSQKQLNSLEIRLSLKKLNVLGSVLYIAAHPDDENTRLIAYMANETMVRTCYLSLTRGDGGQNLIGTEKGPLMGALRTQELLEARKIDGGEQLFTRAVDFGYSKTAEETFKKWGKKSVLADAVWAIRKFRPDVIITRFPSTSTGGHGHHTASAILAEEAFDLAGDPKAFPEQLDYTSVWQPKRLYLNTSTWWDKELPQKAKDNHGKYTTIDVGTYNTLLGKSYSEMASESRTMHKSQGFGSGKVRGSKLEYLELIKGKKGGNNDIFDGIDITWNKIKGGAKIEEMIIESNANFDGEHPEKIVPTLFKAYEIIDKLPDANQWKWIMLSKIRQVISACAGLFVEVTTNDYSAAIGSEIELTTRMVNRSSLKIELLEAKYGEKDTAINTTLTNNVAFSFKHNYTLPKHQKTNPYWLNHDFKGIYTVDSQDLIGNPQNRSENYVLFTFKINGNFFPVFRNVVNKHTDRVKGEIYRPFVVLPKVTANISDNVFIFSNNATKEIRVTLKAHEDSLIGAVEINLPKGWKSEPTSISYNLATKNEEKVVSFNVTPSANESVGEVKVILNDAEKTAKSLVTIEYNHIQTQTLLPEAKAKLVRLNVQIKGKNIGYIKGAGDEVPTALEQLGYTITLLDENSLKNSDLSQYDAIVAGIRTYNTNKYMINVYDKLMEYVKDGGNYVVQYNTNRGIDTKTMAPFPLKLSRNRVTVEEAKVTFLAPEHAIMNTPNKILASDFDNWVQERGLYFPNEWDENYTPILGWSDPNEEMVKGALLVANYGKGSFIYTGISFFRELPAGVPGAFKLFANIISYGR
ncbi:MAG: PIG-L family deacetylase [Flavobacteriaceae bacterium]|nr:PIG-L family deacetylase [Flavobacteriaceae bacterium]PCJ26313.1 MAG: LmbE family protein [Flavobacteriales bacterium]